MNLKKNIDARIQKKHGINLENKSWIWIQFVVDTILETSLGKLSLVIKNIVFIITSLGKLSVFIIDIVLLITRLGNLSIVINNNGY